MKKIIVFAAAVAALALFSSCQKKDKKIKIGVIQLVEHPALDKNYQGFVDGLKDAGFIDGQNIEIDYENAQGEQANCVTIAQKLVNDQSDLIFAIATPAAQAVANMTSDIPILVSSVTDPKTAQLVESNEKPGTNVSGTSDLTPCAAQISLLKRLLPSAKKVAILFCSSEENSRFQANLAEAACQKEGLDFVEATVSNTNEVQQVVQSLVGKVDAIYAPTDNMIASSMATVALVTTPNKIPVICGEEGMVQGGGLATYGINYYELGLQTAKMALEKCDFSYNKEVADELGIEIPADLIK